MSVPSEDTPKNIPMDEEVQYHNTEGETENVNIGQQTGTEQQTQEANQNGGNDIIDTTLILEQPQKIPVDIQILKNIDNRNVDRNKYELVVNFGREINSVEEEDLESSQEVNKNQLSLNKTITKKYKIEGVKGALRNPVSSVNNDIDIVINLTGDGKESELVLKSKLGNNVTKEERIHKFIESKEVEVVNDKTGMKEKQVLETEKTGEFMVFTKRVEPYGITSLMIKPIVEPEEEEKVELKKEEVKKILKELNDEKDIKKRAPIKERYKERLRELKHLREKTDKKTVERLIPKWKEDLFDKKTRKYKILVPEPGSDVKKAEEIEMFESDWERKKEEYLKNMAKAKDVQAKYLSYLEKDQRITISDDLDTWLMSRELEEMTMNERLDLLERILEDIENEVTSEDETYNDRVMDAKCLLNIDSQGRIEQLRNMIQIRRKNEASDTRTPEEVAFCDSYSWLIERFRDPNLGEIGAAEMVYGRENVPQMTIEPGVFGKTKTFEWLSGTRVHEQKVRPDVKCEKIENKIRIRMIFGRTVTEGIKDPNVSELKRYIAIICQIDLENNEIEMIMNIGAGTEAIVYEILSKSIIKSIMFEYQYNPEKSGKKEVLLGVL